MSIQILGHANRANFNNIQQKQAPAFGSKLEIDDTWVKRQISGQYGREVPIQGTLDFYTMQPARARKPKKINSLFDEKTIDQLKKRLTKLFAKNGHDNEVQITMHCLDRPGEKFKEYMRCSMTVGGETKDFLAAAPVKGVKKSSLVKRSLQVYQLLLKTAQKAVK